MLTLLILPYSSVSLSDFILAVPMREYFGNHTCMSSLFPIAMLNGTFFSDSATTSAQSIRCETVEI